MSDGRRSNRGKSLTGLRLYVVLSVLALLCLCLSPTFGDTLNVPDEYPTIQSAIDAAVDGDTVQVAAGTYYENLVWEWKSIILIGAGAGVTIVDGGGAGTCLYMAGADESSRVEGFTFRGGSASSRGGGLYLQYSSATLAENNIMDNSAGDGGGGLFIFRSHWDGGAPTLTGNTITQNSAGGAGGGLYLLVSSATLADNIIMDNSAGGGGGGLLLWEAPATLTNNTVTGNSAGNGGGLWLQESSPTLTGNTITGNSASQLGGGLRLYYSSPTLTSNDISSNSAPWGAGLYLGHSSPELSGNVISGNWASDEGGGLYMWDSSPTLTNNTIAMNAGGGLYNNAGAPITTNSILYGNTGEPDLTGATATYSTVGTGEVAGEGNSSADPMFVDALGGDYHLQDGSPCIDAGNDAAPGLPEFDLDGNPRIVGAAVDMGAYEWQGPSVIEVAIDIKPGSDPNSINLGANGVVPVAVLSTPDFDAASVDAFSLTLSGSAVRLKGKSGNAGTLEDVDADGDLDLVVQFYIDELELEEGATEALLRGCIDDGTPIVGYDSIRVVR